MVGMLSAISRRRGNLEEGGTWEQEVIGAGDEEIVDDESGVMGVVVPDWVEEEDSASKVRCLGRVVGAGGVAVVGLMLGASRD